MNRQWTIIIYGRVQGVSLRYRIKKLADELSLTGWVKNLSDGGVKVVASGNEKSLLALKTSIASGLGAAEIDSIQVFNEIAVGKFADFRIIR